MEIKREKTGMIGSFQHDQYSIGEYRTLRLELQLKLCSEIAGKRYRIFIVSGREGNDEVYIYIHTSTGLVAQTRQIPV